MDHLTLRINQFALLISRYIGAQQDKETMRTNRLWRYTVGLSPRLAEAVFVENDTRFSIDVSTTRSRRFLLLTSASETTSAVRFLSAAEPQGAANSQH